MTAPHLPTGAVILALTPAGFTLAKRLKALLPDAVIHGRAGRCDGADESFSDTIGHLRALFQAGRPIVGICAAGILVRALAPVIGTKGEDPAVLAVAEDGSSAVPLLGGHDGANRLARAIAEAFGGHAAITTAGDLRFGLAFDDPPSGWHLADREAARDFAGALLNGETVALKVEAGSADWLEQSDLPFDDQATRVIRVTDRLISDDGAGDLVLHPPTLALGVGCERGCDPSELRDLALATLKTAGLSAQSVACVVSLDLKSDEPAVLDLASQLGVPARFYDAARLEAETPRLATPSDTVFAEVGCHGVSEGAALAAAGADAELVVPKAKTKRATVAVARSPKSIMPGSVGRGAGRLSIVGIGPGQPEWRTPEVTRLLHEAEDVVGYQLYLDLIADVIRGKRTHDSELAQEEARCRMALDLAAEGRNVALVCSGDAGIYALAALTFELLDREDRADWDRLEVIVSPGVSAFQAAASRIGAPIGHDFCTVSLSDLLTPWAVIQRRLRAAAEGDFVISFYNPVSKRRRTQLAEAQKILMQHRPPDTPVILARKLGREGEKIDVIPLSELTPDHADMLTLVMVGNSETRRISHGLTERVYTPRGYSAKLDG